MTVLHASCGFRSDPPPSPTNPRWGWRQPGCVPTCPPRPSKGGFYSVQLQRWIATLTKFSLAIFIRFSPVCNSFCKRLNGAAHSGVKLSPIIPSWAPLPHFHKVEEAASVNRRGGGRRLQGRAGGGAGSRVVRRLSSVPGQDLAHPPVYYRGWKYGERYLEVKTFRITIGVEWSANTLIGFYNLSVYLPPNF